MKILLTVHQFPPKYISGTEVLTYSVARELMARGHEVRVLTAAPGGEPMRDVERFDEYEVDGIKVYRFTHAFVPMGDQSVIMEMEYCNHLLARYFRMILDAYAPDLVHVFHMSRLGVGVIDVSLSKGLPTYFTPTDFWSVCPTSLLMLDDGSPCRGPNGAGGNCVRHVAMRARWSWIAKVAAYTPDFIADGVVYLAKKGLLPSRMQYGREIAALGGRHETIQSRLNALSAIISPTSLMTDALIRNGVNPGLIRQHMYGINISSYKRAIRRLENGSELRVGFIGGLMSHKGCHLLIDAMNEIKEQNATLKIYGNPKDAPSYYEKLLEKAKKNNSIDFCGTFSNDKISEVLSGIDVLVVPSIWFENAPLVIHSALSAGCPVLASDFPGMSEVVKHQGNGLLFEPGSVIALAKAIRRLLDEDGLLESLSKNCQSPKGITTYVDELLAVYGSSARNNISALPFKLIDVISLDPDAGPGFIAGWAVINGESPQRLKIHCDNGVCAETDEFVSRPDVRKGLLRSGLGVRGDNFGFRLSIDNGLARNEIIIELVSRMGGSTSFSINGLSCGKVLKLTDDCYFGLDQELFED